MRRSNLLESCSKERGTGGRIMSSVAAARVHMRELGSLLAPELPSKVKLNAIYKRLHRFIRDLDWAEPDEIAGQFTKRRVRSLFFGEVRRVDYEQMRVLDELRAHEEFERARTKFIATAHRLADHHVETGTPLDSDTLVALGRLSGLVDLSRDGGDAR